MCFTTTKFPDSWYADQQAAVTHLRLLLPLFILFTTWWWFYLRKVPCKFTFNPVETHTHTQLVSFPSINCSLFWLSLSLSPTLLLTTRSLSGVCSCVCAWTVHTLGFGGSCHFFLRRVEDVIYVLQTLICCTLEVRMNSHQRLGQKVFLLWPSAKHWKKERWEQWSWGRRKLRMAATAGTVNMVTMTHLLQRHTDRRTLYSSKQNWVMQLGVQLDFILKI